MIASFISSIVKRICNTTGSATDGSLTHRIKDMLQLIQTLAVGCFFIVLLPVKLLARVLPTRVLSRWTTGQVSQQSQPCATENSSSTTRSIVLPIYNEDPSTWESLAYSLRVSGWDEVILTIDQPNSETQAAIDRISDPNIKFSISQSRRGKGGALHEGLTSTTGDIIGFIDADGAISTESIDKLYATVESTDAHVAIGSRDIGSNSRASQSALRQLLGQIYSRLAQAATKVQVTDFQCGAKAFDAQVWEQTHPTLRERRFGFDTEFLAHANANGYTIEEVGIEWNDPGDSEVTLYTDIPDMLRALLRVRRSLRTVSEQGTTNKQSLALVSAHPPTRGGLAEYGEKLAHAYHRRDDVVPTVVSRTTENTNREYPYQVVPRWRRDSLAAAVSLIREIADPTYDAVQFNIHMTYFGSQNLHRFVGLLIPPFLSTVLETKVVVTMHDFFEVVEDEELPDDVGRLHVWGAKIATRLLLLSDVVTVTSEKYLELVEVEYGITDAEYIPHGTFQQPMKADGGQNHETNNQPDKTDSPFTVLLFGHLGPTKDVETAVNAFERFHRRVPDSELVIAGGSHPEYPGYQKDLKQQYGDLDGVRFTGYVPDNDLRRIWKNATIATMPYHTMTGVSGVFQLAKSYGVPVVAADVEGMRTSTVDTGGDAVFVTPGDAHELCHAFEKLHGDIEYRQELASKNRKAGEECTIEDTAAMMSAVLAD